jgi:hypothetical protein
LLRKAVFVRRSFVSNVEATVAVLKASSAFTALCEINLRQVDFDMYTYFM